MKDRGQHVIWSWLQGQQVKSVPPWLTLASAPLWGWLYIPLALLQDHYSVPGISGKVKWSLFVSLFSELSNSTLRIY